MEITIERRKYKRYAPKLQSFAALRPEFKSVGRIKDISKGGLAFEYLAQDDGKNEPPRSEIDLFTSKGDFYIEKIPCKIIYDNEIKQYKGPLPKISRRKRCAVQFSDLPKKKSVLLEFFLNNYVLLSQ